MKVKVLKKKKSNFEIIPITTEYIRLDALLKFSAIAETGGEAKQMIQNGDITVNREECTQRGKKIFPGDEVQFEDHVLKVKMADGE